MISFLKTILKGLTYVLFLPLGLIGISLYAILSEKESGIISTSVKKLCKFLGMAFYSRFENEDRRRQVKSCAGFDNGIYLFRSSMRVQ